MMSKKLPSLFPIIQIDPLDSALTDGAVIKACAFCNHAISNRPQCREHYANVAALPEGFTQCPFGFTTRTFRFAGQMWAITGVIAFPRFGSDLEREKASRFPDVRTSRQAVDDYRKFLRGLEILRAETIREAAQVLPQAFHELRKLNGAILQYAEREIRDRETPGLVSIRSAAELVRNNYDILEAISNIDAMKAVPLDATVNLFDLCYKTRSVFLERATTRRIFLDVQGVRAIVRGSQKSFPIVPAVLIENAIKYGRPGTTVQITIEVDDRAATLIVENESAFRMDPERCFDKGARFAGSAVEGSGFGLFLAKEIVIAHHGSIRCECRDRHTTMIVELPLEDVIPWPGGA